MNKAYTVMEFCKAYRTARASLYLLWARGEGPKRHKIGRRVLIDVADAEAWFAAAAKGA